MCGRAYYIDGHRYFGSYPRGHPLTIRPENYGRRTKAASPSPAMKREETPKMKREPSPSPEPKVKTEPASPGPLPPVPIQRLSPPMRLPKRRLSTASLSPGDLQPSATKKLKLEQDSEVAKPLRASSLTPWSPIPDVLQLSLERENEKLKADVEDLRTEMIIQEHLNEALKEENAAAVAYTKKLEEQVRGIKTNVRELRERLRGVTGELEDERRERKEQVRGLQNNEKELREQVRRLNGELEEERRKKEEMVEKKRVERRKMDAFWDGEVFD